MGSEAIFKSHMQSSAWFLDIKRLKDKTCYMYKTSKWHIADSKINYAILDDNYKDMWGIRQ